VAEYPQQDQEQVDEIEVEAEREEQRIVVSGALRLDPPEVVERQPDEDYAQPQADGELADTQVKDQGGNADQDADQQGAEQPPSPRREIDAGHIDDRGRHEEDPNGAQKRLADGVRLRIQVRVDHGCDEEALDHGKHGEQSPRQRLVLGSRGRLDGEDQAEGNDQKDERVDADRYRAGEI